MLLPKFTKSISINVFSDALGSSTEYINIPILGDNLLLGGFSRQIPEFATNNSFQSIQNSNLLNPRYPPNKLTTLVGFNYNFRKTNYTYDNFNAKEFQTPVNILEKLGLIQCVGMLIRVVDLGSTDRKIEEMGVSFVSQSINRPSKSESLNLVSEKFISGYDIAEDKADFIIIKDFNLDDNNGLLLNFKNVKPSSISEFYCSIKLLIK